MGVLQDKIQSWPKAGFVLVGIGLAFVYYSGQGRGDEAFTGTIQTLKVENEKNQKKLEETVNITQNKQKFQEDMERVSLTFRYVLDYLPRELDTQDLLKKISSEARLSGGELSNFTPKDIIQKDFFDEIPMQIKVKGNYQQLVTFLANVSKLPRIINISNVEISNPTFIDGYPHMQMTGTLIGYRYKEGGAK